MSERFFFHGDVICISSNIFHKTRQNEHRLDSSSISVNKVGNYDNLYNNYRNVCGCITVILRCPFPAASASAVQNEVPFTPVHTCSDLSVVDAWNPRRFWCDTYCMLGFKLPISVYYSRAFVFSKPHRTIDDFTHPWRLTNQSAHNLDEVFRGKEQVDFKERLSLYCDKYAISLDGKGNWRKYNKTRVWFGVGTEFYASHSTLVYVSHSPIHSCSRVV